MEACWIRVIVIWEVRGGATSLFFGSSDKK